MKVFVSEISIRVSRFGEGWGVGDTCWECVKMCVSCMLLFTTARFVYAASLCSSSDLLCFSSVVITASWLEARTRGPRDEPRATRELSPSVLLPSVRCLQFQET